jgi:intein/homing endonuclease
MYSYVTVGEFVAFVIGWNMILEYLIGKFDMRISNGFSSCFDSVKWVLMGVKLDISIADINWLLYRVRLLLGNCFDR